MMAMLLLGGSVAEAQRTMGGSGGSRSADRSSNPARPIFTFKNLAAGQQVDPTSVGTCKTANSAGVVNCSATDDVIGGVKSMLGLGYSFVSGRFAGLGFTFFTADGAYRQMETALTDRYGKACAAGVTPYVSPLGLRANFPNKTWCFRTGKLVLKSYGLNKSIGSLDYQDAIYPAEVKSAPVRDF